MTTELRLLARVSYRGQEITGRRLRGLLALLASDLRTGRRTVGLVDGLWPDEQPDNPTKALQILVSRARSQLGPDIIATTPTGYRLALTEEQVDSSAVLLSASASAQHARAGDHAGALSRAEEGLAFWEGAADGAGSAGQGGGDPEFDPVSALRAERASTYGSLVRARALALSRLGRHPEAVEPLTDLARERPRDEELLLELLRCEAATVGAPAALTRYEVYRQALRDELGTDPGAALQGVHQQLLQDAEPAVRLGVSHDPNPLLGRDDDVAAVANLVRTSRVTSIVGPGGLGKTRLAHVVSRQAEQRSVQFVALAGVTTDDDVVGEVASVLGIGEARRGSVGHLVNPSDLFSGIVNALGPGSALLVLDNCEHVVRGVSELVRALVSMSKDVRVLTTSRAPLDLSSESVYLLPELDLATTVELFEQRARAARSDVQLPADVVEELCHHLDGLPLAAELAAARVRVMSVPEIAGRLDDRFGLLRGGARDAPDRHRTLQAVVDWSWNLLDPTGQAAMRTLSVFPGGFTAGAAAHLLGHDEVVPVLEDLVDQSLLKVVETPAGTRFRMLETVREFSTALQEEAGETELVVDGFLAWAREFGIAHHGSVFEADPVVVIDRIRAEQDNLMLALRHGLARTDGATVAAVSAVLAGLWVIESKITRLATLADESAWVLSHFRPAPDLIEVTRTASTLGLLITLLLQGTRAGRWLVTLRRLPTAPPDTSIRAAAIVLGATSEPPDSDHGILRALCESEEPLLAGMANGIATYVWERENDVDGALKAARRMLEVFDQAEVPWMRVMAHSRVGELCLQTEQAVEARRHFEVALRVQEQLGDRSDRLGIRGGLAIVNLHLGAIDEAERWLEMAANDQPDDAGMLAYAIGVRAEISLMRGEVEAGLRLWRQAFDRLRNAESPVIGGDPSMDPWFLELQAVVVTAHARHGRLDRVEEITGELAHKMSAVFTNPKVDQPAYAMELPVCGALLLALAMVDMDRAERMSDERAARSGARMVALAERFHFVRNFQPTMSPARAREAAERADRSAYDDAVSSYADLDRDKLRAAALAVLREHEQI